MAGALHYTCRWRLYCNDGEEMVVVVVVVGALYNTERPPWPPYMELMHPRMNKVEKGP